MTGTTTAASGKAAKQAAAAAAVKRFVSSVYWTAQREADGKTQKCDVIDGVLFPLYHLRRTSDSSIVCEAWKILATGRFACDMPTPNTDYRIMSELETAVALLLKPVVK